MAGTALQWPLSRKLVQCQSILRTFRICNIWPSLRSKFLINLKPICIFFKTLRVSHDMIGLKFIIIYSVISLMHSWWDQGLYVSMPGGSEQMAQAKGDSLYHPRGPFHAPNGSTTRGSNSKDTLQVFPVLLNSTCNHDFRYNKSNPTIANPTATLCICTK